MSGVVNSAPIASSRQSVVGFPAGTKMVFNQTAAPTGWTKVTGSGNDHALRVTTGTVGTGGSVNFETAFASQTPTISMSNAAVTLSIAQMPSHTHTWSAPSGMEYVDTGGSGYSGGSARGIGAATGTNANKGGGGPHTHTNTASSSAIDLNVRFVDVIIATKD
jgi:hypothetical protein